MSSTVLIVTFIAFAGVIALVLADTALRAKAAYRQVSQDLKRSDRLAEVYIKIEEVAAAVPAAETKLPRFSRTANTRRSAAAAMYRQPKLRVAA